MKILSIMPTGNTEKIEWASNRLGAIKSDILELTINNYDGRFDGDELMRFFDWLNEFRHDINLIAIINPNIKTAFTVQLIGIVELFGAQEAIPVHLFDYQDVRFRNPTNKAIDLLNAAKQKYFTT